MSDQPRSKRESRIAIGTLANAPCAGCQRDTLHKGRICQVCGAVAPREGRVRNARGRRQ